MPHYLPWHLQLVYISGVLEIVFGIMILIKKYRRLAAWLIIIMLIVFIPAHIQMLQDYIKTDDPHLWIAILRLPVQLVLIWWAHSFTKSSK